MAAPAACVPVRGDSQRAAEAGPSSAALARGQEEHAALLSKLAAPGWDVVSQVIDPKRKVPALEVQRCAPGDICPSQLQWRERKWSDGRNGLCLEAAIPAERIADFAEGVRGYGCCRGEGDAWPTSCQRDDYALYSCPHAGAGVGPTAARAPGSKVRGQDKLGSKKVGCPARFAVKLEAETATIRWLCHEHSPDCVVQAPRILSPGVRAFVKQLVLADVPPHTIVLRNCNRVVGEYATAHQRHPDDVEAAWQAVRVQRCRAISVQLTVYAAAAGPVLSAG
jgi:hypothetical protein